jgi:catechol 2,3-dioxygenase-like lactoylglutathione lyase family enzyme
MSNSIAASPVAFHISMNVSDIDRSVAFFTKVFGTVPSKHRQDYAKFELHNPPITFSLEPGSPAEQGALNHVGFKLQSAEELVELQRRLEMAGIHSEREEGVECCYSKQTKFWLHDPDGTLWELYILEGDLEHRGAGQTTKAIDGGDYSANSTKPISISCLTENAANRAQTWSHRLGTPLAISGDIAPDSLDEAFLQGSLNGPDALPLIGPFLTEVADRLKQGGRISLHCLTADRHVEEVPRLPGPASVVNSVPCLDSLIDHLESAGFEGIRLLKYGSHACFTLGEAELRETMIEAWKPKTTREDLLSVMYKGPFSELKIEGGPTIRRGRRALLSRAVFEHLQSTPAGDSFVILETATSPVSCTG